MKDSGAQVTSFVLNHMKIADMSPRERFKKFDRVHVIGTQITGMIERIDADGRLAWLITARKDGWWYLKDLTKTFAIKKDGEVAEVKRFRGLQVDFIVIDDPLFSGRAIHELPLQVP